MTGRALSPGTASPRSHLLRAGGVVGVALMVAVGAVALCRTPLLALRDQLEAGREWSALPLDLLMSALASLVLVGCVAWLVLVTAATALEATTGASVTLIQSVSPLAVRRVLLVCCGAAVGSTAVLAPAVAAGPRAAAAVGVPVVTGRPAVTNSGEPGEGAPAARRSSLTLSGLSLPDRTVGGMPARPASLRPVGAVVATPVADRAQPLTHRVRPGESLWSIAQGLLPGSGAADLDTAWRRIYRKNRSLIGPDPDHIVPGTTLRLPPELGNHHGKDAS